MTSGQASLWRGHLVSFASHWACFKGVTGLDGHLTTKIKVLDHSRFAWPAWPLSHRKKLIFPSILYIWKQKFSLLPPPRLHEKSRIVLLLFPKISASLSLCLRKQKSNRMVTVSVHFFHIVSILLYWLLFWFFLFSLKFFDKICKMNAIKSDCFTSCQVFFLVVAAEAATAAAAAAVIWLVFTFCLLFLIDFLESFDFPTCRSRGLLHRFCSYEKKFVFSLQFFFL